MQVKRFVAEDMRTAMRGVKEELGGDAVILSNRVVDGQVEILAARDYDENLINTALNQSLAETQPTGAAAYYEREAALRDLQQDAEPASSKNSEALTEDSLPEDLPREPAQAAPQPTSQAKPQIKPETAAATEAQQPESAEQHFHQAAGLFQSSNTQLTDSVLEMRNELKSLRNMIENQKVLGEWNEMASKHPLRVSLYKQLSELGLSQEVCKYLSKGLDSTSDLEHAVQAALKQLIHQLKPARDDILAQGGTYAMVGPTGVGKTTTIAKLAARFAMQHGQKQVALISTDTYRIGAHEQLMTYGRLLGVAVYSANDAAELQQLLLKLQDKKLVLIDTAGMSQRDLGISQQFAHLSHPANRIKPYLVLSANAQLSTLDEVIIAFKAANPVGCILTKLDEAASLGGVLSALLKHQLAAAYYSDGQKVPEDLQSANAAGLVKLAIQQAKKHREPIEDEFLAATFMSQGNDLRI